MFLFLFFPPEVTFVPMGTRTGAAEDPGEGLFFFFLDGDGFPSPAFSVSATPKTADEGGVDPSAPPRGVASDLPSSRIPLAACASHNAPRRALTSTGASLPRRISRSPRTAAS